MSSLRTTVRSVTLLFSIVALSAACGGAIDSTGANHEVNDTSPGGSSGGAGGSAGAKGGGGSAGGSGGTCTAAPSCDPGDKRVSSSSGCLEDDARCYQRALCGATIWCTGEITCQGLPSCKAGYSPVDSCPSDADCVTETRCGVTISCLANADNCAAYPSCNPGDLEVASPGQCLQDDAVCYPRTLCGATIWCTGTSGIDAGGPPPPPVP